MGWWDNVPDSEPGSVTSNSVTVLPCESDVCGANVAVIIYGGWNGIPVKAYVGGTPQPTMYTALDAKGEAAVLWTFYPPAGTDWNVLVEPQTPPGLDGSRWQYKLVRVVKGNSGRRDALTEVANPSSQLSIESCNEYVFYYQLIDTQAP